MLRFFLVMALVVVGDQLTKLWILKHFTLYESAAVIPGLFSLTCLRNSGAAFGMLADLPMLWRQVLFIAIAVIALIVMVIVQRNLGRRNFWYTVSCALIGGGAVGNLIDRLLYGSVVDFLDFYIGKYHWPAFNVADSGITAGVGIFLLIQFLEERAAKRAGDSVEEAIDLLR